MSSSSRRPTDPLALGRLSRLVGMLAAALTLSLATRAYALDDTALRARYALPQSQFVEIDGDPIHVVDEGRGPAIVLIHGSFASLREWDGWAKVLSRRYRVIRFDDPPEGLSGPSPVGDYSVTRKIAILDALTKRLGVGRFYLVATSSGGLLGAAYAAERPERVKGLVLNNIGYSAFPFDTATFSPELKKALAEDALHPDHHDPEFWRQILLQSVADPSKVTPELVEQWTDFSNRVLRVAKNAHSDSLDRTPGDLARITTPTLLIWSAEDKDTTLVRDGLPALRRLAAKDKSMMVLANCGHLMPLDCGDLGLQAVQPFFDRLDKAAR